MQPVIVPDSLRNIGTSRLVHSSGDFKLPAVLQPVICYVLNRTVRERQWYVYCLLLIDILHHLPRQSLCTDASTSKRVPPFFPEKPFVSCSTPSGIRSA